MVPSRSLLIILVLLVICSALVTADKGKGLFSGDILQADLDSFTSSVSDTPTYLPDNQSAVTTNPQDTQTWIDIGKTELKNGEWRAAQDAFSNVIDLDPKNTEGWEGLLLALRGAGDFSKLHEASEESTTENPDFASGWKYQGIALSFLDRTEEALDAFDKAVQVDPEYFPALYNKGIALDNLERYNESVTAYEAVLALNPEYTKAWNNKGAALYNAGRYDEAVTAFDKALALDPQFKKASENKAIAIDEKRKKSLGSIDIIDDATVIAPVSPEDDVGGVQPIITVPTSEPQISPVSSSSSEPSEGNRPVVTQTEPVPDDITGSQGTGQVSPVPTSCDRPEGCGDIVCVPTVMNEKKDWLNSKETKVYTYEITGKRSYIEWILIGPCGAQEIPKMKMSTGQIHAINNDDCGTDFSLMVYENCDPRSEKCVSSRGDSGVGSNKNVGIVNPPLGTRYYVKVYAEHGRGAFTLYARSYTC